LPHQFGAVEHVVSKDNTVLPSLTLALQRSTKRDTRPRPRQRGGERAGPRARVWYRALQDRKCLPARESRHSATAACGDSRARSSPRPPPSREAGLPRGVRACTRSAHTAGIARRRPVATAPIGHCGGSCCIWI